LVPMQKHDDGRERDQALINAHHYISRLQFAHSLRSLGCFNDQIAREALQRTHVGRRWSNDWLRIWGLFGFNQLSKGLL
ncbi:hypothetical protein PENTCL1PPCAC_3571, partial [Pristionchus entomophagus]